MRLACKQHAVILDARIVNLSVGSGLIVLFDALLPFLVELIWGEVWVSELIVFRPVRHYR